MTTETDTDVPGLDGVAAWLLEQSKPEAWAAFLAGLAWQHIKPVVTISAVTGNHPAVALAAAAAMSSDAAFKAAAAAHLEAKTEVRPNRAQRRAKAKGKH